MALTTPFVLSVQLSPMPDPDPQRVSFGVSLIPGVNGRTHAEQELTVRFKNLQTALQGIEPPKTPGDSEVWNKIERAYRTDLSELLPYTWQTNAWRFILTNGTTGLDSAKGELEIAPYTPLLSADSNAAVVRGLQHALYDGTKGFNLDRLDRFHAIGGADVDLPPDGFLLTALLSETSRWPAPIPQTVLRTAFFLSAKRDDVRALTLTDASGNPIPTWLQVVVEFETAGGVLHEARADLVPATPAEAREFVYSKPAGALASLDLRGLPLDKVLAPAQTDVFLDPYNNLWLNDRANEFGGAVADRDWHSSLHAAIENAGDAGLTILEALRNALADGVVLKNVALSAADWFRAGVGALRDTAGPGLIAENDRYVHYGHAPLAAQLVSSCEEEYDIFNEQTVTTELKQAVAMMHILRWYVSRGIGTDDWIDQIREAIPSIRETLPAAADLNKIISAESPADWLARLERVHDTVLEPKHHSALLLHQWRKALADADAAHHAEVADAKEFLRTRSDTLLELSERAEAARLARRDAALDLVSSVVRWDKSRTLDVRLTDELVARIARRASNTSLLKPLISTPGLTTFLQEACKHLARNAMQEVLPDPDQRTPDAERQPLLVNIDTLNDDGDQGDEADVNSWLRGYGAFVRWSHDASGKKGPWSNPLLGHVRMEWQTPLFLSNADGSLLETLSHKEASAAHGVRDSVLRLDNEPWLHQVADADAPIQMEPGSDREPFTERHICIVPGATKAFPSSIPRLGFGLTYWFVPSGTTREGGLADNLATQSVGAKRLPYLFAPAANLDIWLDSAASARKFLYLRTVSVGAVRARYPSVKNPGSNSGPLDIAPDQPIALRAFDAADQSGAGPARDLANTPNACVLLDGLPNTTDPKYKHWQSAEFSLQAPQCSAAVYDAWIQRNIHVPNDSDAWRKWRVRLEAAERVRLWAGSPLLSDEDRKQHRLAELLSERLDDPAVQAIVVRWTSWKTGPADPVLVLLQYADGRGEDDAPVPDQIPGNIDNWELARRLLSERAKTARKAVRVTVKIAASATEPPVSTQSDVVIIAIQPGSAADLGEVQFFPAVRESRFTPGDMDHRFDGDVVPNRAPEKFTDSTGSQWRLFTPERLRIEVATPASITREQLFTHCRTKIASDGGIELWWDRLGITVPAFDNVSMLTAAAQAWRTAGKPLSRFPEHQVDLDAIPPANPNDSDPTSHAVVWDAEGFAEREEDATTTGVPRMVAVREHVARIWHEPATMPIRPRYVRLRISARHRYADLYRQALGNSNALPDVIATAPAGRDFKMQWRRAYRAGRWENPVPAPAVKIVVPLTRPYDEDDNSQNHTGDLLVMLNEEWGMVGGLAESLEVTVHAVERRYTDKLSKTREESSYDVIVSGRPLTDPIGALRTLGPLGHTFDTDSNEPLFVTASFIVRTPQKVEPGTLVKLALRRVLLPEMMDGYYGEPNTAAATTLDGRYSRLVLAPPPNASLALTEQAVVASGEGSLSVQGIAAAEGWNGVLTMKVGEKAWTHRLTRSQLQWSIADEGTLPDGALKVSWSRKLGRPDERDSDRLALRHVAVRLKPAGMVDGQPKPAVWEIALYARYGKAHAWERVGHWQFDQPEKFDAGIVATLPAGLGATHASSSTARRFSAYVDADWNQILPDADKVPIGNNPWSGETRGADLRVRKSGDRIEMIGPNNLPFTPKYWVTEATMAGPQKENQGLFHLLLVTRTTRTADEVQSEAPVGLFKHEGGALFSRFDDGTGAGVPLASIPDAQLRASVLLVQVDRRGHKLGATPSHSEFWKAQMADGWNSQGQQPRAAEDARLRVLAVTRQILGYGAATIR